MFHKYGEFEQNQIAKTKEEMRKRIFYFILIADPDTRDQYKGVNVEAAFSSELHWLSGLNEVLFCPPELVRIIGLLEAALHEYQNPEWQSVPFRKSMYRKLVLDAGSEVLKIKEV